MPFTFDKSGHLQLPGGRVPPPVIPREALPHAETERHPFTPGSPRRTSNECVDNDRTRSHLGFRQAAQFGLGEENPYGRASLFVDG